MADTSKPRARRRPSSTASVGAKGKATGTKAKAKSRTTAQSKPKSNAGRTSAASGSKAPARGGRRTAGASGTRRLAHSSGGKGKGKGSGRRLPGPSLRTLVMGSVAAALVVVGAAIGVTVDKVLRDDSATPVVETATAPKGAPAPKVAPVPEPRSNTAAPPPPLSVAADPAPRKTAGTPVSPPRVLASSEARDYAHAAKEYQEVPPSYPPATATSAALGRVPAPRVKPPVPREHQLAALPTPAKGGGVTDSPTFQRPAALAEKRGSGTRNQRSPHDRHRDR